MNFRRNLIRAFTFLGGIYFFLEFVLPAEFLGIKLDSYHDQVSNGFIAVGALAIGLGLINILSVHLSTIVFKRTGFANSIALLFGLMLMFTLAALDWHQSEKIASDSARFFVLRDFSSKISADFQQDSSATENLYKRNLLLQKAAGELIEGCRGEISTVQEVLRQTEFDNGPLLAAALERFLSKSGEFTTYSARLAIQPTAGTIAPDLQANAELGVLLSELGGLRRDWLTHLYGISNLKLSYALIYDGLFVALGSAMFSLLGFYIASAAYRAFRVRSVESALMLLAAFLVMLGQIPFGLWISEDLPSWRLWILEVPNSAAFRAIKIGAAVAGLVMAFRMWLSIESESFGERKKP